LSDGANDHAARMFEVVRHASGDKVPVSLQPVSSATGLISLCSVIKCILEGSMCSLDGLLEAAKWLVPN
jgi:hypothetical protein